MSLVTEQHSMRNPRAVLHWYDPIYFGVFIGMGLLFISELLGQQNHYQGSVPEGAASRTALSLTIDEAIQRGLKSNLGLLESQHANQTARAERIQALSVLLPQVTGRLAATDEEINLKTVGINVPSNPFVRMSTIVGPFSYTDAQANVSAKIFDWNARRNLKSAKANEEAARLSVLGSHDLV